MTRILESRARAARAAALLGLLAGCTSELPRVAPALVDLEQPLERMAEPDDEAERRALDPGGFTGVYAGDARETLSAMLDEPEGLEVTRVVENSPAAAAGLAEGDILLKARIGAEAEWVELVWASQWRELELAGREGDSILVVYDRAGALFGASIEVVARLRPAERAEIERFREEERVGAVLRTATEVEARAAKLAPGGGAVVVGLSRTSPWRAAGVRFGDLIVEVGGEAVADPRMVLDAVRRAPPGEPLSLLVLREGEPIEIDAAVSRRAREWKRFELPFLLSFERDRELSECSLLLGLVRWRRTPVAWDLRLLWVADVRRGDADRLRRLEH